MAWRSFQWGSRGLYYDTGLGVYVAHIFIPACVQVTLFGTDESGNELLHVFHAKTTNPLPTSTDCTNIATAVANWVTGGTHPFRGVVNTACEIVRVIAQSIAEFEGPFAEQVIGVAGTRTGTPTVGSLCAVIKKTGDHAGRSRRGYFASWPANGEDIDAVNPNLWKTDFIVDLEATYHDLLSSLGSGSHPLVIASKARGTTYPVVSIDNVTRAIRSRETREFGKGR